MESKTTSRWGSAALTSKSVHAATAHIGKQESAETTGVLRLLSCDAYVLELLRV